MVNYTLQDISLDILKFAINKFNSIDVNPEIDISIANGYYLPFADKSFDRIFQLNTFGDIKFFRNYQGFKSWRKSCSRR